MRKTLIALATTLITTVASAAPTVLSANDGFNTYANGSIAGATGGSGWAGAWQGSAQATVDGGALVLSGVNEKAATRAVQATSSNVLVSFTVNVAHVLTPNDFLGFWFDNTLSGQHTNVPNVGLKGNQGGSNSAADDLFVRLSLGGEKYAANITAGVEYTILAYLQKDGGSTTYNRFDLWVNPDANDLSTLSNADATATGSTSLSSFSYIGFRTANLGAGETVRVDDLSLRSVPEPGSVALAGLALLGLAAARRRR